VSHLKLNLKNQKKLLICKCHQIHENLLLLSTTESNNFTNMKTILLSIIGGLLLSSAGFSQSSGSEFNTDEITWFGIDYTHCYFLNPIDFPSRVDLKNKLKSWNDLVVYEQEKFIEKTLQGKHVEYETDAVEERNNAVEIKSKITEDGFKAIRYRQLKTVIILKVV